MTSKAITSVTTKRNTIKFETPNDFLVERANALLTSEPETIAWIENMSPEDILWDVGANVGTFSLYAALEKGMNVRAFEPESANFHILNKNIRLNRSFHKITAYPIAVGTSSTFTHLYLDRELEGWACNTVGENSDAYLQPRKRKIQQGSICFTLSQIAIQLNELPTHLKIDIDGLELEVLKSGKDILINPNINSVLIELNLSLQEHKQALVILEQSGFSYHADMAEKTTIKEGYFKGMNNFIFHRNLSKLEQIYDRYQKQA